MPLIPPPADTMAPCSLRWLKNIAKAQIQDMKSANLQVAIMEKKTRIWPLSLFTSLFKRLILFNYDYVLVGLVCECCYLQKLDTSDSWERS